MDIINGDYVVVCHGIYTTLKGGKMYTLHDIISMYILCGSVFLVAVAMVIAVIKH